MTKTIVDENLISFKVLEQKIFDYVCELGRLIPRCKNTLQVNWRTVYLWQQVPVNDW